MGLSGSQAAYKDARANRARSGASRANWYATVNVVVLINGTDRTTAVQFETLGLSLVVNDEPDTAKFSLVPSLGFTPQAGQSVVVSLGSATNAIFSGQIVRATERYVQGISTSTPWWDVECTDYSRKADRRFCLRG